MLQRWQHVIWGLQAHGAQGAGGAAPLLTAQEDARLLELRGSHAPVATASGGAVLAWAVDCNRWLQNPEVRILEYFTLTSGAASTMCSGGAVLAWTVDCNCWLQNLDVHALLLNIPV